MTKFAALAAALALTSLNAYGADRVTDAAQEVQGVHHQVLRSSVRRSPIAYGTVYQDGTVESGSGNFTASWNAAENWYQISITGVSYYYLSYTTNLSTSTPFGNATCQVDSVSGLLLVRCYNAAGQPTQATFDFTTF